MSTKRYDILSKEHRCIEHKIAKLIYASSAKCSEAGSGLPHIHNDTEICYVVSGAGNFRIMDSLIPVSQDDMILINPKVDHTEIVLDKQNFEYILLGVEGLEFRDGSVDGYYCLHNFRAHREEILCILQRILQEVEEKHNGCQQICQNLFEILVTLIVRYSGVQPITAPIRRASKECAAIKRYIDTNFKESITLDQLAEMAHVNKYYLVHSFSREYNTSPINYLIERRVCESCHLLCDTDHSLSQISRIMGFSSPSYFSQSFRKVMGISPLEYRKQRQDESTSV